MSHLESRDPERVRRMFGGIAPRYDLLNRLLSFRRDVYWRREAARELGAGPSDLILDLCGGTGDLSVELARGLTDGLVACCDFSAPMLARTRPKFRRSGVETRSTTLCGDALHLPFREGTFHAVAVAFGVRNLADMEAGFREVRRVLRPGGRFVVLEFSRPTAAPLAAAYRLYLNRMLPAFGDRVAGREGPYRYLARTIGAFPEPDVLAGRIREAGFAAVGWKPLTGGIVAIHTAWSR